MDDIFDREESKRARDEAIERVRKAASHLWKEAALEAVRQCAREKENFTADAVWRRLDPRLHVYEQRAMGPVMRRAREIGWIVPTDRFIPSDRVACHRRPQRVWHSCVYQGDPMKALQFD